MADLMQVLEGATYAAFIAGAIFAVIELRSMSKDRETEFLMRMNDTWSSKDFQETLNKIRELQTEDPREIEDRVGKVNLNSYIEYLGGIAILAQNKSLKKEFVLGLAEWFGLWEKLEPWILDVRTRTARGYFAADLEWLVEEDQKWFFKNISRSELNS